MADILNTSVKYLTGVGPKKAEVLSKEIDVETYLDLLHYFPYKYIDRSRIYTISEMSSDMPYIQLCGTIREFKEMGTGRKRRLVANFHDKTGVIELVWFKGFKYIEENYQLGRPYIIFGKPALYNGIYNIAHPEIDPQEKAAQVAGGLVPIYNTSEKMKSIGLNNRQMQKIMHSLMLVLSPYIEETLPAYLLSHTGFMNYPEAVRQIHFPENARLLEAARQRLKFEELFFIQLKLQSLKHERKVMFKGIVFTNVGDNFNRFYNECLMFELTGAQKRVVKEIRQDTLSGKQMNRLLQGDVGSGKTLVALLSMLLALDNDCQACLMAPTEILARQHHAALEEMLRPIGLEVGILTGSSTARQRAQLLPALADGSMKIIVGTHALLEPTVIFKHLGLAVIDEQHRFGVEQRSRLWQKNQAVLPHILIMSATPIPRTLAMTLYGDLDISVIDELPPGRKPIQTIHRYDNSMVPVYNFIRQQIELGRQVYVVYPMIEESKTEDLKNLEAGYELYCQVFPEYEVTWVHGKMKAKEKNAHMQHFVTGKAKILLATTVIEVGVNVPNASVMVIEAANRFGLSQLHQLRGRVGRGADQSYCILVTGHNLSEDSRRRIKVMVDTNDGFEIAEEDMRLRGFGELEGTRQSGKQISLKIANPARDGAMVQYTRDLAEQILSTDPEMSRPEHLVLKERMNKIYHKQEEWGVIS